MTEPLLIIQNLPVFTLAKSPLIIASLWTITFPCSTMFWDPHSTVCLLTLLPEAYNNKKTIRIANYSKRMKIL